MWGEGLDTEVKKVMQGEGLDTEVKMLCRVRGAILK
jgi:hypothetical protein